MMVGMANTRQKQKTRSANAGGSGDILLAAFIMRPQSESQIGAELGKLYVKSRAWTVLRDKCCGVAVLFNSPSPYMEFLICAQTAQILFLPLAANLFV
jgi:hypothetical protein